MTYRQSKPLPHFKIPYDALLSLTEGILPSGRQLSASTIHMAIAAIEHMKFNRYWMLADGSNLSEAQILLKNDMVDKAIYELLIEYECASDDDQVAVDGTEITYIGGYADECESEEDMPLRIVHIGGIPYLQDDGYDGTKFYRVTEVGTSVGADGGVCVLPDGDTETPRDYPDVGDDYLACYSGKIAAYLLDRAYNFYEFAEQLTLQGLDAIVGNWDELADTVAMILDLLGGEDGSTIIEVLRGDTLADVDAAMHDQDYIDYMASLWTVQGAPTRFDIAKWAAKTPTRWNDVKVAPVLSMWVNYSFWPNYQNDIAVFAYECTTGNTITDVAGSITEVEENGRTFLVYDWSPNFVLDIDAQGANCYWDCMAYPSPVPAGSDTLGLYMEMTTSSAPDIGIHSHDTMVHAYWGQGDLQKGVCGDADARAALEAALGITGISAGSAYEWGYAGLRHYYGGTTPNTVTITRCAVIVEVL